MSAVAAWRSLAIQLAACLAAAMGAAEPVIVPEIADRDRLASWNTGVAAADDQTRPLQIVCIGDSNTEMAGYVCELRRILQGCYGERGIGFHSLGDRTVLPESPKIVRTGKWDLLRDAPKGPPPPRFALDGIWAQTTDAQAEVGVEFAHGSWEKPAYQLARAYNIQQRVRLHYQVGPDLGGFTVLVDGAPRLVIDAKADKPGYMVSEPFLCDGFRVARIKGKAVLFGFDAERVSYLQGKPVLAGGVLVHALGKSWGRTEEPALVDDAAYAAFYAAIRPDLITILLGTNDQHNDGRVQAYRDWLTTTIGKLRKHSPGTGILVIACPEAGQTKPGLAVQFRDAAREVAAGNGCAFWSLQDLIGPRSAAWTRQGFLQDGLHYHPIGGGLIARMLLRQIGFDLNDLRHYPALRQSAPAAEGRPALAVPRLAPLALDGVAAALAGIPAQGIWRDTERIAEVRLAVAGDALAVHARVADAQCMGAPESWTGGSFELCIANPSNIARVMHGQDGPVVRQVVFQAVQPKDGLRVQVQQYTMDAHNTVIPWKSDAVVPAAFAPLPGKGYDLTALIPLAQLSLTQADRRFLVECAVTVAAAPGAKPQYLRMFATRGDAGAFRDASLSAEASLP